MQDKDTRLGSCVACQIGAEVHGPTWTIMPYSFQACVTANVAANCACLSICQVQPLPAQLECARCDAKDRIPVDCGLPSMIKVHKGYYRPDGVPPTVSLISSDVPSSPDDVNVGAPPTMAVACPWGTKSCAGGPLHGNASCVTGHHGNFCAECWAGWFRGAS